MHQFDNKGFLVMNLGKTVISLEITFKQDILLSVSHGNPFWHLLLTLLCEACLFIGFLE